MKIHYKRSLTIGIFVPFLVLVFSLSVFFLGYLRLDEGEMGLRLGSALVYIAILGGCILFSSVTFCAYRRCESYFEYALSHKKTECSNIKTTKLKTSTKSLILVALAAMTFGCYFFFLFLLKEQVPLLAMLALLCFTFFYLALLACSFFFVGINRFEREFSQKLERWQAEKCGSKDPSQSEA